MQFPNRTSLTNSNLMNVNCDHDFNAMWQIGWGRLRKYRGDSLKS